MGNLETSFIAIINKFYHDDISDENNRIHAHSTGQLYSDIVWDRGGPIPQNELEAKMIDYAKEKQTAIVSEDCENCIMSGFQSSALGTPHIYDSEFVDQINLVGAWITTSPNPAYPEFPDGFAMYYACRDVATGIKNYFEHTHAQLRQVIFDGSQFKLMNLQWFHFKRVAISECLTIEEVEAITWTSPF